MNEYYINELNKNKVNEKKLYNELDIEKEKFAKDLLDHKDELYKPLKLKENKENRLKVFFKKLFITMGGKNVY